MFDEVFRSSSMASYPKHGYFRGSYQGSLKTLLYFPVSQICRKCELGMVANVSLGWFLRSKFLRPKFLRPKFLREIIKKS